MSKTNFNQNSVSVEFDMETLIVKNLIDEKSTEIKCISKSDLFRKLYDFGLEISEISKQCNSHYSFVYGVISSTRDIRKVEKTSKSDIIRQMFKDGKKVGEISKELNSNYSFVFSVVKKYKSSLVIETKTEVELEKKIV